MNQQHILTRRCRHFGEKLLAPGLCCAGTSRTYPCSVPPGDGCQHQTEQNHRAPDGGGSHALKSAGLISSGASSQCLLFICSTMNSRVQYTNLSVLYPKCPATKKYVSDERSTKSKVNPQHLSSFRHSADIPARALIECASLSPKAFADIKSP